MYVCMYVCMYVEEDNLSPFDSNIACLSKSIEINNNKHVYRQSQVRMPKRLWGRVGRMLVDHRDGLSSSSFGDGDGDDGDGEDDGDVDDDDDDDDDDDNCRNNYKWSLHHKHSKHAAYITCTSNGKIIMYFL